MIMYHVTNCKNESNSYLFTLLDFSANPYLITQQTYV